MMSSVFLTKAQTNDRIGYIVYHDDVIRHYYIGLLIFQYVEGEYACPFDFSETMAKEADGLLSKYFKDNVIQIPEEHFITYIENEEKLSRRDFKDFRESWFDRLLQQYGLKKLIVFRNRDVSSDYIGNSKYPVYGFGLYNGAYKKLNFVYFHLEALVFEKPRPAKYYGETGFTKIKTLPRIMNKNDSLTKEQLFGLEQPLNELIIQQFHEFYSNYEFKYEIAN